MTNCKSFDKFLCLCNVGRYSSSDTIKRHSEAGLAGRLPTRNLKPAIDSLGYFDFFSTVHHSIGLVLQPTLTLNLITTTIVAPPSNASKWQMGFNSAFKGSMHNSISTYMFFEVDGLIFCSGCCSGFPLLLDVAVDC